MSTLRNIPWPRVLAESAIIVASILLALWVDAWWADRQRGIEQADILASLHEELQAVIGLVDENEIYAQAINDSTLRMTNASIDSDSELTDREIDQLFADVLWHIEPSFTSAPLLESLVNSGDLDIISNSELRRQLGVLVVQLAGFRQEIQRESAYYNGTFIPYVQEHVNMAQIFVLEFRYPGFPDRVYPPYDLTLPKSDASNRNALKSREFQNILLHRLTTLSNILQWWTEIAPQLEHLAKLVEKELEVRVAASGR